ncbi:MAG: hypothetical protein ACM3NV_10925 [Syntrophothermus sp.]
MARQLPPARRARSSAPSRWTSAIHHLRWIDEVVVDAFETYCAAGPLDKVRLRVEETAERADGLSLTPSTYIISPEELSEFQNRIIDAFRPEA